MPLWVHTEGENPPEGSFLIYKARPKEELIWVDNLEGSEPMTVHLPIIKLAGKLEILDI